MIADHVIDVLLIKIIAGQAIEIVVLLLCVGAEASGSRESPLVAKGFIFSPSLVWSVTIRRAKP